MEDYEKKYKEVIGRARTFSQRWQEIEAIDSELALQELKEIFPELKESEDEKIRKSIIGFLKTIASLKDGKAVSNEDFDSVALLEWAAWLEKQGEQKPAWSEEDERMMNSAIWHINNSHNVLGGDGSKTGDWLKSLKERLKGGAE